MRWMNLNLKQQEGRKKRDYEMKSSPFFYNKHKNEDTRIVMTMTFEKFIFEGSTQCGTTQQVIKIK